MITQTEIKAIADHLTDALLKEDLSRRDAAAYLNLNPCYITMAMNPKFYDSMSRVAKDRIKEWHDSRDLISAFQIPAGEELWKPAEKVTTKTPPAQADKKEAEPVQEQKVKEIRRVNKIKKAKPTKAPQPVTGSANSEKSPAGGNENFTFLEVKEALPLPIRQKFTIDLEINLFINGQKIQF